MSWYKQVFTSGETIYALSYDTLKNGNRKAVIISTIYKKAKHTSLQNMSIWKNVEIEGVPALLRRKLLDKAGK